MKRGGNAFSAMTFHLCDGTTITQFEVLEPGTPFGAAEINEDITLATTSVLRTGKKVWRAVHTVADGEPVYHQISIDQEEALIGAAVKGHSTLKPSFTRWAQLAKTGEWPANGTHAEQELFGPHCCVSTAFVDAKVRAKRERDARSRKRRQNNAPAPAPMPKAAKVTITFEGPPAAVWEALRVATLQGDGGGG